MSDEYGADLVTVLDDEGNEHQFELLDAIETDDGRYVALLPVYDDADESVNDDGELIILEVAEENGEDVAALRERYIEEYKEEFFNPYKAAEYGKFEDVIEPADSRRIIINTLRLFKNKQVVLPAKKHGNMPV